MRVKTQDPKYDIEIDASSPETARLVNAATGKPIPDDEPIMIWRAQDKKAVGHIWNYADTCENQPHRMIVEDRAMDFENLLCRVRSMGCDRRLMRDNLGQFHSAWMPLLS